MSIQVEIRGIYYLSSHHLLWSPPSPPLSCVQVHSDSVASTATDSVPLPLRSLPAPPPPECGGLDDTLTSSRSAAYILSRESSFQQSFAFDSFDEDDLDGLV